jgi:hypothetical protein
MFAGIVCALVSLHTLQAEAPMPPANDRATLLLIRGEESLKDESLLAHKLSTKNTATDKGRFGKALDLRGDATVSVRLKETAQPREAMSLECWAYLEDRGDEKLQRVIGRSSAYGLYISGRMPRPGISFYTRTDLEDDNSWKSVSTQMPLKKWVHLAATYDGIMMRLYIDGLLKAERENKGKLIPTKASFYIGTAGDGAGKLRFLGLLDEIRFSKVARTDFFSGKPLPRGPATIELRSVDRSTLTLQPRLLAPLAANAPKVDGNITEPFWKEIPPARFVESSQATEPKYPTHVRAAWDSEHLYLAFRGFEKGQETWRAGTTKRDDTAIFKGDSIEIFIQPPGMSPGYYQFAVNPVGGIWDTRWERPRKMQSWNGEGVRLAGQVRPDDWTVEMAIPFKTLGRKTPRQGSEWRVNFCRTEVPDRELTCWSYTGGGYHIPERFGHLQFSRTPGSQQDLSGTHGINGTIQEENGDPVAGIAVLFPLGFARTDAFGDFRLRGVSKGEIPIIISSPRYQEVAGLAKVSNASETLVPITLKRVDPYRPAYTFKNSSPITWLKSSITEPVDMVVKPKNGVAGRLRVLATLGEHESRSVAFYSHMELAAPRLTLTLNGSDGTPFSGKAEVRWTQRLLKRKQYTRPREDAVFSWRYLWREPPARIEQGQIRHLVITVKVPEGTAVDTYKGELALSAGAKRITSLPVELEVLPFHLVTPQDKRVGVYYRGHDLTDEQLSTELSDIHEHGGSVLVWHSALHYTKKEDGTIGFDTSRVRHAVEMQKKHGIGPPYMVGTAPQRAAALAGLKVKMTDKFADELRSNQKFKEIYAGGIKALTDLEKELNAGEFLYTWMDEVFGRGRFEPWKAFAEATRALSKNRIYITFHNRNQEQVDKAAPWVDVRGYHGHTIDWWLGEGHTFTELAAELNKSGDEAWNYYNIREIAVTSEWVRLCNGYWLWRSPITAHTPWIYYSYGENPYDDLDSDRHDYAYAAPHPTKPEMVSTLEWECFREGYDDLRYVVTLEDALIDAEKADIKHRAVDQARAYLKSLWDEDPRVPIQAEKLTPSDYANRRRELSTLILELHSLQSSRRAR